MPGPHQRRREHRRLRRVLVRAGVGVAVLAAVCGYAVADAADEVPGVLTTASRPVPAALPRAPGALAPLPPAQALLPPAADAPEPDPAVLGGVLGPLLGAPALGGSAGATVLDARTGRVLLDAGGSRPHQPASVAKLFTAAAVLGRLGPSATLATRVVDGGPGAPGGAPGSVVLVGGGDVLLSAGAGDPAAADGRAGLVDLAGTTAAALRAAGRTSTAVQLDDTLSGSAPQRDPTWGPGDVAAGYVAPLTSLAVDAGRTSPGRYAPRQADPGLSAATTFAGLLAQRGIAVAGAVTRTTAPVARGTAVLAEVRSAPLADVVRFALAESDNTVAEALARQVGLSRDSPPGFAASADAVLATLRELGVDTSGAVLVDASGLGAGSSVPPAALAGLLAAASGPDHPQLRPLLAALPVGGLTGTLGDRFTPGGPQDAGAGLVRAKTGSLTGVTSLAGSVVDADGRQLVFAVLADRVGPTDPARAAVDAVVDALVACGCR